MSDDLSLIILKAGKDNRVTKRKEIIAPMKHLTTQFTDSSARGKLLILALFCLIYAGSFALIMANYEHLRIRSDFFVRWHAITQLIKEGRNLYDPQNGAEIDQILYGEDNEDLRLDFYYPAYLLVVIGPLGFLPYYPAYLIWTTGGQLFLVVGLAAAMWAWQWPRTVNQVTVVILFSLLWVPTFQHTLWGQFNTLGVLSLGLSLWALRHRAYGWAGVAAAGLLFKPHPYLLLLVFFGLWSVARRERWGFVGGLAAASGGLWLIAEWLQPGWVLDFWHSLGRYVPQTSVVDILWNPHQVTAAVLVAGSLLLFIRHRQASVDSLAFACCLTLSLSVWFLVLPVILMFHILALPIGMITLLARLQVENPRRYWQAIWVFLFIYLMGWVGFVVGQFFQLQLTFSLLAYKMILPIVVTGFALPGALGRSFSQKIMNAD